MSSLKKIKPFVITFLFFLLVLSHFSGTVTGDEEKVYNFIDSFIRSESNLIIWLNNPIENCQIWNKCHSAFLKHNLGWFFFNLVFYKISEIIFFFKDFINERVLIELSLSFFNTSLFFLSFFILYKTLSQRFTKSLTLAGIILLIYGSYLNNLSSGGYIETVILFLLSLRMIFLYKKNLETRDYIFIAIIDSFLISLRFFYFWVALIFLIINISSIKKNKFKIMNYFLFLFPIIFIFYSIQNIIPTYAYLNTNELNTLNLIDYYFIKIQRSFCVDNAFDLILIYSERVFRSFFSLSVGIFFIFPIFVFALFSNNKKIIIAKLFILLGFVCAFSLEQNFYLPAGISGHRGLAPLLIIFLPEIIEFLEKISKSNNQKSYITLFIFFILLFTPSLYYRSTLAHYTVFTKSFMKENKILNTRSVLVTEKNIPKCYKPESFIHNNLTMNPGFLGWKILISKELKKKNTKIPSNFGEKIISLKDFPPQTLIHRSKYLIRNDFYNYENNILKKITQKIPIVENFINIFYYLSLMIFLIIPSLTFIYLMRKR